MKALTKGQEMMMLEMMALRELLRLGWVVDLQDTWKSTSLPASVFTILLSESYSHVDYISIIFF